MLNALTVDVEEYFHPTEVQKAVEQRQWADLPSRIEDQLLQVLQLLDAKRTKATFFVLGWVAERNPRAIRKIVAAGHEIGCHSHFHRLVYSLTPQEFRRDTRIAVAATFALVLPSTPVMVTASPLTNPWPCAVTTS